MITLPEIIYDIRARNTWCKLPYPNHPKGCPNYPRCPQTQYDFRALAKVWNHWYAVIEEFDLLSHALRMKVIHPTWTERQCRNLLYWQGGVRNRLLKKALAIYSERGDTLLKIPEACGINVFETMAKVGVIIDRHPDIVRKVMLVGKKV